MAELIRDQIASLVAAGLRAAQEKGALPELEMPVVDMERPRQSDHGDYARIQSPVSDWGMWGMRS